MHAGGVIPDVASVARNPALAGFNCHTETWGCVVRGLVQCRA